MTSLCETTSQTYCNLEIEFLSYQNAKYTTPTNITDFDITTSIITVSDVLATFVEAFDVEASVSICGEDVSSNITVYRKQYLFDVFVRVVEKKYGACTGVNIPVWLMRGYDVNPDNINSNGSVGVITNSVVSIDSSNCNIIQNNDNKIVCVKLGGCSVKIKSGNGTSNPIDGGDTGGDLETPSYTCATQKLQWSDAIQIGFINQGRSIDISSNGNVIVFGIPGFDVSSGAIAIYRRNTTGIFVEEVVINRSNSDIQQAGNFGYDTVISGDGNTIVSYTVYSNLRHIYVYRYINQQWILKVKQSVSALSNRSSYLSISDDGSIIAYVSNPDSGNSYNTVLEIFSYSDTTGLTSLVTKSDIEYYVNNISTNSNGSVIVIGTLYKKTNHIYNTKTTLVYTFDGSQLSETVIEEDINTNSTSEQFIDDTYSVVSKDGNTIAVGIPAYNVYKGVIKIYEYNITTDTYVNTIDISDNSLNNNGHYLDFSPDGTKLVSGGYDSTGGGVYVWSKNTDGTWNTIGSKKSNNLMNTSYQQPIHVAMSNDTIVGGVDGEPYDITNYNNQVGAVYTFCVGGDDIVDGGNTETPTIENTKITITEPLFTKSSTTVLEGKSSTNYYQYIFLIRNPKISNDSITLINPSGINSNLSGIAYPRVFEHNNKDNQTELNTIHNNIRTNTSPNNAKNLTVGESIVDTNYVFYACLIRTALAGQQFTQTIHIKEDNITYEYTINITA